MKRTSVKIASKIFCSLFFLAALTSCSMKSEKKSFNSRLDEIDALINQRLYKEAVQELSEIEKEAYGSWAQLGVFRRYKLCDENQKAERLILRSLKKNSGNLELRAVYSNFLLRQDRIEEALQVGKKLQGTKYGSVYSAAVIRSINENRLLQGEKNAFLSMEYFPVYYDAYVGSADNAWLRNCALIYLSEGSYAKAAEIKPKDTSDSKDAYFWALTMFDSRNFGESIDFLEISRKLLSSVPNRKERRLLDENIALLLGDSYTSLKDEESAEKIRTGFIENLEKGRDGWIIPENAAFNRAAVLFTNSARWALDNLHEDEAQKLLLFAVEKWPDFVPALSLYADFAYRSNLEKPKDFVQLELSDAGLASLEMELYDNRAKIPLSDAAYRINQSLERTHDPLLQIIALDFKYKTASSLSEKQKQADLWNILEKTAVSPYVYPELMLDYALSFLLSDSEKDLAWNIYSGYVKAKYGIENDAFFFENLISNARSLDTISLEYGSFFAALQDRGDDAAALYGILVYAQDENQKEIKLSPFASDISCMNLAMILSSMGEKDKAVELYGKTFGRCVNLKRKSVIMRRISEIYFIQKDFKNARRSAEYALSLDKTNVEARMLLNRIKAVK